MKIATVVALLAVAIPGLEGQTGSVRTELVQVEARQLSTKTVLPGELRPYQHVDVHAKVAGFVEAIHVDRGSFVKQGALLAKMSAPEFEARRLEAEARVAAADAERTEVRAKLASAESTHVRLLKAAETVGAVAENDVVLAEKEVQAVKARADSIERTVAAQKAVVRSIEEIQAYLTVTAPFAGVITERQAHPGALAGPNGDASMPLLTLAQISRLRLVAAVPEAYRQSVALGRKLEFSVSAFPGRSFTGTVARPAFAVDPETRTMPVELDVENSSNELTPGMYAELQWVISRSGSTMFVPRTAIKATTERIFVIRVTNGIAEWVDVRRGVEDGDAAEVFGDLDAGDLIVLRATDEIRPGTRVISP